MFVGPEVFANCDSASEFERVERENDDDANVRLFSPASEMFLKKKIKEIKNGVLFENKNEI